jgi:hypothetical protein
MANAVSIFMTTFSEDFRGRVVDSDLGFFLARIVLTARRLVGEIPSTKQEMQMIVSTAFELQEGRQGAGVYEINWSTVKSDFSPYVIKDPKKIPSLVGLWNDAAEIMRLRGEDTSRFETFARNCLADSQLKPGERSQGWTIQNQAELYTLVEEFTGQKILNSGWIRMMAAIFGTRRSTE